MVTPSSNDVVRLCAGLPDEELDLEGDRLERASLDIVVFIPDRLKCQRLQPWPQFNHRLAWIAIHCPDPQHPGCNARGPGGSHLVIRGSKRKANGARAIDRRQAGGCADLENVTSFASRNEC